MQQKPALNGLKILVTRPAHQTKSLSELITEQGGQAILFPLIEINPVHINRKTSALLNNIKRIDYAVFISPNAVEYGIAELLKRGEIPAQLKLVTIGQASAKKLQQISGRNADIYPVEQYNSEALLAHSGLTRSNVDHKQFIIYRGVGGRELLADTLKQRGAIVHYAEVYQRSRPAVDTKTIDAIWNSSKREACTPDIITITSNEGLNNLVEIFSELPDQSYYQQLIATPLVVVTEEMHSNARSSGFTSQIIVAAKASNEALIKGVLEWQENQYL
ncbi:MAG: uroporphyrinogen-III synthase [gamma proteobacterium symbiont of Taylorina sp.]|nr:uroporphyrinogen-III synthase [gamma proteobacterium symbiont of Taylorina sp.]